MQSRFARFCFVVFAFVFALCLMAASPHTQPDSGTSLFGGGDGTTLSDVQFSLGAVAVSVRSGLQSTVLSAVNAVTYVPRHVARFIAHVTDVRAFIKPADAMQLPVIVPLQNTAAVLATPAVATPAPAQPVVVATTTPQAITPGVNKYAWGNCTWWVFARRAQVGDPIPNNWGNAATWASRAARDGYAVDHTPSPRAIMQTPYSAGGLGHVALVESVEQSGVWHISEMNTVGLGVVSHRALAPAAAASYNFIHDR